MNIICYSIIIILLTVSCKSQETNTQPNIVVIQCDDLGYGDLSSYGHPIIETPNLDQMSQAGIKLTNFYAASPVCSPSRVGLLTGRNPNRAGIYDHISVDKKFKDGRHLVHMQADEITIPALLKTAGYVTCLSGKWHCNLKFNSQLQPQPNDFGFDHWFATHNNASPTHENPINFVRNGKEAGPLQGFSCQIVVDEAINWLKKGKGKNPFYLHITFHEPHEPIASPANLVEKYLSVAESENQAQYFANVENMDRAVGRLIEFLTEKYGDNTLVVFSSDNGPETLNRYRKAFRSHGTAGKLKGMKLWTTEGGVKVPGLVYWIGKKTYKGTTDAVVSSLDYLPTFCELAGIELPNRTLDGQSMTPVIETGKMERKKPLLWCFYHAINKQMVAMRSGDWKILSRLAIDSTYLDRFRNIHANNETMVKRAVLTDFELYHIHNDPNENKEVSQDYPETFKEMKAQIRLEYKDLLDDSYVWVEPNESK